MKTVITYGTFDLFHVGHVRLLRRLKALGSRLVVGCSTDAFNREKGKNTVFPYEQRVEILSSLRFVDRVIPESSWEQKREDILRESAHIFAMGDDWAGKFDDLSDICEVMYLSRTADVSTTEVRQMVNALHQERVSELKQHADRLRVLINAL